MTVTVRRWTDAELKALAALWPTEATYVDLEEWFGRWWGSIQRTARTRLKLPGRRIARGKTLRQLRAERP